jgi:hypothetical protein
MESKQLKFIDYRRKQTITTPRTPPLASDGRKGRSGGAYRKRHFSGHGKILQDRISASGVELPILVNPLYFDFPGRFG